MRKSLVVALILSTLVLLTFTTSAFALNGPHQGPGFADDTDACAGCHRAHTGTASKLLAEGTTKYTFCSSCHNGSGANSNVQSGVFEGDEDVIYEGVNSKTHGEAGKGLNGGGFVSAVPYTGRSGRGGSAVTLSGDAQRHDVTGGDNVTKAAYGGGDTGPSQDIDQFTCVSCHDPHGTRNEDYDQSPGSTEDATDGSERYRILRGTSYSTVNGKVTADIKSNEGSAPDYTKDQYKEGMPEFCVACHTQYLTQKGTVNGGDTGKYDAGDGQGSVVRYRHSADAVLGTNGAKDGIRGLGANVWENMINSTILPVDQPSGFSASPKSTDKITCLTCHQSHGSEASVSTSSMVSPANSSTLLRLDDRGVCQACHKK